MKLSRLILAATLLTIAACSSPTGLRSQTGCTLDPEDGDMVCPAPTAQQ